MPLVLARPELLPIHLSPASYLSLGVELAAWATATPISSTWPLADLVLYIPFVIPSPCLVVYMWTHNGATAAGNTDIGIYDTNSSGLPGAKLASIGVTAQSGTNAIQTFNITDVALMPGRYWLALKNTLSTSTFFRFATSVAINKGFGILEETTGAGAALPATATPVTTTRTIIPVCGLSLKTTI